jgi:hypothetical protein
VQLGAFDSKNRRHPAVIRRRIECIDKMFAAVIEINVAPVLDNVTCAQNIIEHADIAQMSQAVAIDEYAGALKTPFILLLDEPDNKAARRQRDSNAAAGNAGADDEDLLNFTHRTPVTQPMANLIAKIAASTSTAGFASANFPAMILASA